MKRLLLVLSLLALPALLEAQCETQWLAGVGVAGVVDARCAAHWDPDGSGPASPRLVVGGAFSSANGVAAANIAMRDPVAGNWVALGAGIDGTVRSLAVLANGELVAAGQFDHAGGVSAANVARWNGTTWAPLATGLGGEVVDVAIAPNGDLIAVGAFDFANGSGVARWDGVAWTALPPPVSPTPVLRSVIVLPNGDVAVGTLAPFGSVSVPARVVRWDGTTWSVLASFYSGHPLLGTSVEDLAFDTTSGLIVGGNLGAGCLALESQGFAITPGAPTGTAYALLPRVSGEILIGGDFTTSSSPQQPSVHSYNGSFSGLGSLGGLPHALLPTTGGVIAIGSLDLIGRTSGATWNGVSWQSLDPVVAMNGAVVALVTLSASQVVAGGVFTGAGGVAANHVAIHNGSSWAPLGAGLGSPLQSVHALAVRGGNVIAGGTFELGNEGGIAQWDGVAWSSLTPGLGSNNVAVHALAVLPNQDVIAGGSFLNAGGVGANHVARWDGTAWLPLGSGIVSSSIVSPPVHAIVALPNGDVVVGGVFTSAGGVPAANIARWDGTSWHALGAGVSGSVNAMVVLPSGGLVAGGWFATAGGTSAYSIAHWNGTWWSPLGSGIRVWSQPGEVFALQALPNGDIAVAGDFTSAGGLPAHDAARWDGTAWSALATALVSGAGAPRIRALAWTDPGVLIAAGQFAEVDGVSSLHIAQLATTCPATTATVGAPCLGSAGPCTLTVTEEPWVGSSFRAIAAGLATPSIAISIFGLQTSSLPFSSLLPQGVPGCSLLVSPDIFEAVLPISGAVSTSLAIPNAPGLANVLVHHQVAILELDLASNLVAMTGTNALQLTLGLF